MPHLIGRSRAMNTDGTALKTDLYELTMAAGYYMNGMRDLRATFELFCHKEPPERSYFIACGLGQAVEYILNLKFQDDEIDFLKSHPAFRHVGKGFFDYLKSFRFTGDVWAMREGEPFFAKEPIIQVDAPVIEAQILETHLLSIMHIESLVATKASRVVRAASCDGMARGVVDFGSRRAHGPEAAVLAARAAYIAGCLGTSNVHAGRQFGIPIYGTMAHSWIETFDNEEEAFLKYHKAFPENTILLIDTYDTVKGARKAIGIKKDIKGVRIDSGNLDSLSRRVRKILDSSGMKGAKIIASGNLNEYKISDLVERKAPIDIFGVGTDLVTSRDLPSLDVIYKLVQIAKGGVVKFKAKTSPGKETVPGRKQVFRVSRKDGTFSKDVIGLFSERPPKGSRPLLEPVIEKGRLIKPLPDIESSRRYARDRVGKLPPHCLNLRTGRYLKTELSRGLKALVP